MLYDPKALLGIGHCAALVGNDWDGWKYYSHEKKKKKKKWPKRLQNAGEEPPDFTNYGEFVKGTKLIETNRYSHRIEFPTSKTEDDAMHAAGRASVTRKFNFFNHNCTNTCRDVLNALGPETNIGEGGFRGFGWFSTTRGTWKDIKRAAGLSE